MGIKGLLSWVRYVLCRVGFCFQWGRFSFYCLRLDANFAANTDERVKEVIGAELAKENILGWIDLSEATRLMNECDGRLFLYRIGKKVVASCWVQSGRVDLDFLSGCSNLAEDSRYLTHVIVSDDERGRGYAYSLLLGVLARLRLEGVSKVYLCCDVNNLPIRKVFFRLGFCFYLGLVYLRISFFRLYFTVNESGASVGFKCPELLFLDLASANRVGGLGSNADSVR